MTEIKRVSIFISLLAALILHVGGAAYGQPSGKTDGGAKVYSGQVTDNTGEPVVGEEGKLYKPLTKTTVSPSTKRNRNRET